MLRAGVALVAATLLLVPGCTKPPLQATGPAFTIMTYNVNFGMPRPDLAVRAIAGADADIVCLQETTPAWEWLLRAGLGDRYPHMVFKHLPAAGGMAILAKRPFEELFYHQPAQAWFPGWAVTAETAAGRVQVLHVHLRPPLKEGGGVSIGVYLKTRQTRRSEMEELVQRLDPALPGIVLGDLNENEQGQAMGELRRQRFADALSQFDPWSNTWRWPMTLLTLKDRFDHIVHSPQLRCLHARVIHKGASDHFPVVARFELQAKGR